MEPAKAQVTGRGRVVAAYKGGFADRVPAYPIAGCFAGCLEGLSIEEYCTNPQKATRAMLNYYERYQPDIMIAFKDLAKEAEGLGCRVKYPDYMTDKWPTPWLSSSQNVRSDPNHRIGVTPRRGWKECKGDESWLSYWGRSYGDWTSSPGMTWK